MSEEDTLNPRLAGMLEALGNPKFDSKNPHFKNKYVGLEGILEAVKPHLFEYGFNVYQTLAGENWQSTLVDNESGKGVRSVLTPFIVEKQSPQAVGSALTYYRRYGILLLLNLVGEADDDAEKAEGRGRTSQGELDTEKEDW